MKNNKNNTSDGIQRLDEWRYLFGPSFGLGICLDNCHLLLEPKVHSVVFEPKTGNDGGGKNNNDNNNNDN